MRLSSSDFLALRAIGWPWPGLADDPAWRALCVAYPQSLPARVVEQHRSGYVVARGPESVFEAESLPQWQRRRFPSHERAAVGDWVLMEGCRIVALLPRRTEIKRGAAGDHYHQQIIGANIDTVFIVCGLDADFNPRRIERYRLLVGGGGVEPVVVLTKADCKTTVSSAMALGQLAAQEIAVHAVNAHDPQSVSVLQPWLQPGRTVVLVGSSGAGKSTLTNTLLGSQKMRTGEVRGYDSRGRHTTTHRALIVLPSCACLIDTPGMRELKPTGEEEMAEGGFADIEALAAQCRFHDCRHQGEPGCAVRAAIAQGVLDPRRLASYLKLREEVAGAAGRLACRLGQRTGKHASGKRQRRR